MTAAMFGDLDFITRAEMIQEYYRKMKRRKEELDGVDMYGYPLQILVYSKDGGYTPIWPENIEGSPFPKVAVFMMNNRFYGIKCLKVYLTKSKNFLNSDFIHVP